MDDGIKHLTGIKLYLAAFALAIGTFLITLDYSIANVSIPYITGDIGASFSQGTYIITFFAIGTAIVLPITGWLSERVGVIRLTILALLGFIFFSWVCGMSRTFPMIVTARFVQGLFAGPLIPLSQTLIIMIFPKEKKEKALAFWTMVAILSPVVGPILGGYISYDIHWSWIFFINIPIGLLAVFLIATLLRHLDTKPKKIHLDWVGLVLLAVGVTSLQFLLDKGEQYDWFRSNLIRTCLATSVVCFTFLIVTQLTKKKPLLDLSLFRIRSYATSIFLIATGYALYFGNLILVPLWLQEYMGYTPIWAGLAIAPMGIAPLIFTPLIVKLDQKVGPIIPLAICLVLFSASSFEAAFMNTDITFFRVALSRFIFSLGMLFFIVPLFALSLQDIPEKLLPKATGLFHFVRAMMGAVGTSLFTTLWIRRSAFHHANLAGQMVDSKTPTNAYLGKLKSMGLSKDQSWAVVNNTIDQQASVLALNDVFFLMGWIFLLLIAILLYGRKQKQLA